VKAATVDLNLGEFVGKENAYLTFPLKLAEGSACKSCQVTARISIFINNPEMDEREKEFLIKSVTKLHLMDDFNEQDWYARQLRMRLETEAERNARLAAEEAKKALDKEEAERNRVYLTEEEERKRREAEL